MWEFVVNLLNWIESHVDVSLLDHVDFMQHFALTPLFFYYIHLKPAATSYFSH